MQPPKQNRFHELFKVAVAVKAVDSVIEIVAGLFLYFISPGMLSAIGATLIGNELEEQPRDVIWNYVANGFHHLPQGSRTFWALLLFAHGVVKLSFVIGLWKKKVWSYPLAIGAFSLFIIYQIRSIVLTPSLPLEVFTFFDILIVLLIINEYHSVHKNKTAHAA